MKQVSAIIILVLIVLIYENTSGSDYEPIDFYPQAPVIDNQGQWYEWSTIRGVIQGYVKNKNFNQLEQKVQEVRNNGYQFATTNWVLYDLYNVIVIDLPDYEAIHAFINEWKTYNPNSNIPDILEARAHRAHAWDVRGNGYSSYVSEEQHQGFQIYLEKSWHAIERAEQKGPMDSELCAVQIELAFAHLKNKAKAKEYFRKCIEIEPGYVHSYYMMRSYLQPIWYGSNRELQRFIEKSADDTRTLYGDGLYALLVSAHTFNTSKIFAVNGGPYSWPRVKAGFQHIFKRYGESSYIWHSYGYCAMLAEDYDTFAQILKEIGTQWDDDKKRYFKKKSWYNYHLSKTQKL